MAWTLCEVKWIMELMRSLGIRQSSPTSLYCDNQAALHIASNPVFHERTKHIEFDCHFIRDAIIAGLIVKRYVKTTEQLADILTKPLARNQFHYLLGKMGVRNLYAPS